MPRRKSLTLQTSVEEYSCELIPGVAVWPPVGYAVPVDRAQVDLTPPPAGGPEVLGFRLKFDGQ